jgi:hypothetical protein
MVEMMAFIPDRIDHDIFRIEKNNIDVPVDIAFNFSGQNIKTSSETHIDANDYFDKIVDKIAEIKTKEWAKNG